MSQTTEDRIFAHYRALKKRAGKEDIDPNWKWITLAQVWKMPVRAVKDIVNQRKSPTMVPVFCCEKRCRIESWRPGDRTDLFEAGWSRNVSHVDG